MRGAVAWRIVRSRGLTMLALGVVAFALLRAAPGDPAGILLRASGDEPTPEALAATRRSMGLDQPYPTQFGRWVIGIVHGDLGRSFRNGLPVAPEVWRAFGTTLRLASVAWGLTMALSLVLASSAARRDGGFCDRVVRTFVSLGASLPGFAVGLLLMRLLAVEWKVLPVAGFDSPRHVVIPAVTLTLGALALHTRLLRAGLRAAFDAPFVDAVRAKGLPEGHIIRGHLLRIAAPPSVAASAVLFGNLLVGSTLIEPLFAIPGLGRLAVDAVGQRDQPVLQAYVLLIGAGFIVVNLIADLSVVALDPRLREATS